MALYMNDPEHQIQSAAFRPIVLAGGFGLMSRIEIVLQKALDFTSNEMISLSELNRRGLACE